jgi:hypothetical protein
MVETVVALWLLILSSMAPYEPPARLERVARTVALATEDPTEQALLLTVSFYETTFERSGIPYGVSACRRRGATAADYAADALRILRRARRMCPRNLSAQLGFYHHGAGCVTDAYSLREAFTYFRIRAHYMTLRRLERFRSLPLGEDPPRPRTVLRETARTSRTERLVPTGRRASAERAP